MDTMKLISIVSKLSRNKDEAMKMFLQNFFNQFPEWDNETKRKVLENLVKSFEKTLEEMK